MNKLFVLIIKSLSPLWVRLGADPRALALILSVKLKVDDRGGYVMGKRQAPNSGMEFLVFAAVFLFGCLSIGVFFMTDIPADALAIVFSFWLVYIGMILVTEMSDNLFDTRDLYILFTRPISDTTLSLSKMLHIGAFTSKLTLSLGTPLFVFIFFYYGIWAALTFFASAILITIITIVSTLLTYLLLLRYAPAHKVKKWISYLQICMATIFFLLYQLPNIIGQSFASYITFLPGLVRHSWGLLFPGFWVSGFWAVSNGQIVNTFSIIQALLALTATVSGIIFYVRQSSNYGQKLANLSRSSNETSATTNKDTQSPTPWSKARIWMSHLLTRPGLERASFNFHWRMIQRDMLYKQQAYPSIVIIPVLTLGFLFRHSTNEVASSFVDRESNMIVILYLLIIIFITPLISTKTSKNYEASWIFMTTPLKKNNLVSYGQLAAVLSIFFVPIALIVYSTVLYLWGADALLDITLSLAAALSISSLIVMIDSTTLPFSRTKENSSFNSVGPLLLGFIITPILGITHYSLAKLPWFISTANVLSWLFVMLLIFVLRRQKSSQFREQ